MKVADLIKSFWKANKAHLKLLQQQRLIYGRSDLNAFEIHEKVHIDANPCFVLSTGRCGTALMTNLLSLSDQVDVQHEPFPELIWYSKYAYENTGSNGEVLKHAFDAARYEYIRNALLAGKKYVETNNRITFFAYQIAELYPRAKFIHLIREPEAFVRSGIPRGWYSGSNLHDEGRIMPLGKEMNWKQYSDVEKVAWLWNETNGWIENFKSKVDDKKIITLKAEELFADEQVMLKVYDFIEVDPPSAQKVRKMLTKKVNKSKVKKKDLNKEEREQIKKMAPLAVKYYNK